MRAIILFSGGLDSTVILAMALAKGRSCYALSFDYNQRHRQELYAATELAKFYQVPHLILKIDAPAFANSALLTNEVVSQGRTADEIRRGKAPSTYVPGRNTLFLAYALGQAEALEAQEIYFGCNALDASPYVDCRPAFIEAFQSLMNVATEQAVDGHPPQLITPLLHLDKRAIVRQATALRVPLEKTWSCYSPSSSGKPCQLCDACRLRSEALANRDL